MVFLHPYESLRAQSFLPVGNDSSFIVFENDTKMSEITEFTFWMNTA